MGANSCSIAIHGPQKGDSNFNNNNNCCCYYYTVVITYISVTAVIIIIFFLTLIDFWLHGIFHAPCTYAQPEAGSDCIAGLRFIPVRMHINTQSGHREFHPAQYWKFSPRSLAISALESIGQLCSNGGQTQGIWNDSWTSWQGESFINFCFVLFYNANSVEFMLAVFRAWNNVESRQVRLPVGFKSTTLAGGNCRRTIPDWTGACLANFPRCAQGRSLPLQGHQQIAAWIGAED